MEQRCANCRYIDLDASTIPCVECCGTKSDGHALWRRDIDDVGDTRELLVAIFETQIHAIREMERIRKRLEKE